MKLGKAFQELVYSISTQDKYAEFDSRKSFNRVNKPVTETETNLLSHPNDSSVDEDGIDSNKAKYQHQGVHEVKLAWRHIKNWVNKNSPDLNSSLQTPCTDDDLDDFQKDLAVQLPQCVLEFFKLNDGQYFDDYNQVGGLMFGLKLMPLDEILVMTQHWRKVSTTLQLELTQIHHADKVKQLPKLSNYKQSTSSFDLPSQSSSNVNTSFTSDNNNNYSPYSMVHDNGSSSNGGDLGDFKISSATPPTSKAATNIPQQKSIPPGAIHSIFAHPMWIPLITDEVGNCIGVDLSPPASGNGKWGQVILFGREYDTKFLLADNLGDFLLIFANDLEMGNWDIKAPVKNNYGDLMIGNEGDLVFFDKETATEKPYLTVLKQRSISKWINSLDFDNLSDDIKTTIADLKSNPDSILNVKTFNNNSMDSFIKDNLNLINVAETSMEQERMKPNTNSNTNTSSNSNSNSNSNTNTTPNQDQNKTKTKTKTQSNDNDTSDDLREVTI